MTELSEKEFELISGFLKQNYGIHLGREKRALVAGRLENVLKKQNFRSFADFYDYVVNDKSGEAITTLINRMTTNHTYFMREIRHFEYFKNSVLPFLAATVTNRDLGIWSAGCSSGEEPYTLAMIMADYFQNSPKPWDTRILATDISTEVLSKAAKGIYANDSLEPLPKSWQNAYFCGLDAERSILTEKIKDNVIFRHFNLKQPFPFKRRFHVIFCRNVMIYFGSAEREALINKFYEYTEPGGYLFVGHSETINRERTRYKYIMPAVYRRE
ncbi:hypothetical protein P22_1792 [Propionispora sp. 2/2-37]|uniref:CheR family methyltransferase n=1 Tax=Propionispora sp. 2/2-37 TaxID=1677858 RepID=UPI0006BB9550|nr:protein-glutamate O-methyltransferase CheR [Propionispora sp. 2/2-37]CUH95714.1 hypothetical protein P22_1792 [Propionispora sp. 2/2-37]